MNLESIQQSIFDLNLRKTTLLKEIDEIDTQIYFLRDQLELNQTKMISQLESETDDYGIGK